MSTLPDSGTRDEYATGAVRDGQTGKGRFDLIPFRPQQRIAQHYENGAKKYSPNNWRLGLPLYRYRDSAARHLMLAIDDEAAQHLAKDLAAKAQREHFAETGEVKDFHWGDFYEDHWAAAA